MRSDQTTTAVNGQAGYVRDNFLVPRRTWPDAVTFREAIQHPQSAIGAAELRSTSVSLDRMGMPLAYSGRFAVVFRLATTTGEWWAFRCFTSPGEDGTGHARALRYQTVEKYTAQMPNTFVPFSYLMNGIRIGQDWFPALAMRWAPGKTLGRWVEEHLDQPEALRTLCGTLTGLLERLEAAGIAHGDWQHDNLLISEDGKLVTLVDYDGMYVPEFAGQRCPEMGHPNYQHPDRVDSHFGPGLDRFPCLVIETALLALTHQPDLWGRYSDGESLLFKHTDLLAPEQSPLFAAIRDIAIANQDETLTESLVRLKDACLAGADSTLLPAMAAADAPAPIFGDQALTLPKMTEIIAPPPASGKKWWAIAEAAPASKGWWTTTSAAGGGVAVRTVASAPRRTLLSSAGTPMNYLARLEAPETLQTEQAHLWKWRAGSTIFTTFIVFLLCHWIFGHGFPPFYFLWILNFASLGYGRWPRQRIAQELTTEIEKMETLIRDRNTRMRDLTGSSANTNLSLTDFVAQHLRSVAIDHASDPATGVNVNTVRLLKGMGIRDALSLRQNIHSADMGMLAAGQVTVLSNWYQEAETQAAVEYRKANSGKRLAPEADRLRHEIAEFERHLTALKQERDLFPDAGFPAYLRKLAGLDSSTPQSGTTP